MKAVPLDTSDATAVRVLVVDDDRGERDAIRGHLAGSGLNVEVSETSDVDQVHDLARADAADCILLDYRFPSGNAFELFEELLAETCSTRAPIVLLTDGRDEAIAALGIQLGAQEYLSKTEVGSESLRLAIESAKHRAVHERLLAERDEDLKRLSLYDPLTDLPNRRLYFDRLAQTARDSARTGLPFAVLMMDLNLFKEVNDTYGHEAGDELLKCVGERLRGVMRDSDTVARLGGDEFAALLSTTDSLAGALVVADKVCEAIEEPIAIGDHVTYVGIAVGIAMAPEHGDSAEVLLRHADTALYESKRTARNVSVFGKAGTGVGREARLIAQGLKGALAQGELFTVYQPQIRLNDRSVVGVEALVRWRHPDLGVLTASKFVPAAERSQVIEGLTLRVLELALAQSASWREGGLDLGVAVNLSAQLLERDDLAPRLAALMGESGVPPETLCLEVTETGLMRSPDAAERTLSAISDLGVRLSIDDFGTGYSSLQYLRDFPMDEIKIDGMFVSGLERDPRDAIIVESVLALGDAFGVRVVAEGIEDDTAWSRLQDLGCRYGQGYRIGHPMAAADFDRWREGWRRGG